MNNETKNNETKNNGIKNNEIKPNDESVTRLVQSVRHRVPEIVDAHVNALMMQEDTPKKRFFQNRRAWVPLAAAASLVIAAVFIFQPFAIKQTNQPEPEKPISEIKTELELPDSNIKIIWFQKKDFKLKP